MENLFDLSDMDLLKKDCEYLNTHPVPGFELENTVMYVRCSLEEAGIISVCDNGIAHFLEFCKVIYDFVAKEGYCGKNVTDASTLYGAKLK